MATRNFSHTRLIASLSAAALLAGCQTAAKRTAGPIGGDVNVTAPTGTPPVQPPPPAPAEHKKVAVILGPGGAKALAHVGVLRALQQQRVPIDKIVGLEWGSLIAAMFADKGQTHDIEWKLYKMEQRGLPRPKGFFAKNLGEDSIKIMDDFLQDAFLKDEIGSARIPFACPSRSVWTGVIAWQNRGQLKEAVRRCLAFPPLFKIQGSFVGGASAASDAVEMLRNEGYNVIILVNVLGSAMPVPQDSLLDNLNYVILWQEIRRALHEAARFNIETVNVDTSQFPMVQFESKKELIGIGESAGQKAAAALVSKYGF
jgi:NTE family protein